MSYKLRVEQDHDPESPREWDNVGTIVANHRRYQFGDVNAPQLNWSDLDDWEQVEAHIRRECDAIAVLPLYLYDHSGITVSTTPFACRWDSGQVGIIFATAASVEKLLGDDATEEAILQSLRGEVETYDQYLRGDIWGYVVEDRHGRIEDSCWGFYGEEDATQQGEHALRYCIDNEPQPCVQAALQCAGNETADSCLGRTA